jgi:transcriptional regulator with XRE-family HTH domain
VLERYGSGDATAIYVSRRERGTRRLTLDALLAYALALRCSPLDLLGDEDTEIQVTCWATREPPPARRRPPNAEPQPMTFVYLTGRELRAWFTGAYQPFVL